MPEFRFAQNEDVQKIANLLRENDLPVQGVDQHFSDFIIATENSQLIGSVGLEVYGPYALFRSLAVDRGFRSQKIGKALFDLIKAHALSKNVRTFYLLTTTARDYFLRLGFTETERSEAPRRILETQEFQSLCPSSASCLKLDV